MPSSNSPARAFRRIAVEFGDPRLEFGRVQVVVVRSLGVRIDRVSLLDRIPEQFMPHQHDIEHAHVLVGELVLLQLAEALARVERDIPPRSARVPRREFS